MPIRRTRRRPPELSPQQVAEHAHVLAEATSIYRPARRRAPALPSPPPHEPASGHSAELAPWAPPHRAATASPDAPPAYTQRPDPLPLPPETATEITGPLPPLADGPTHDYPRGGGWQQADSTGPVDRDEAPQSQIHETWTPRPRRAIGGGRHAKPEPEPAPHERPIEDAEAAALAWAFALDLESWDEEHPQRRAAVLARYLPDVQTDQLGWDGTGRQRAETATAGPVQRTDPTHVTVDLRVRVTPYVRVEQVVWPLHAPPDHEPAGEAVPAAAPSPVAPGWAACDSEWKRLRIPITRNQTGGLVIDLTGPRASGHRRTHRGAC